MKISEAETNILNSGRVCGKRPYPIVRYCWMCAPDVAPNENNVRIIEDNVSDTDDVYLYDDDEVGLTFTIHKLCAALEWYIEEGGLPN